LEKYPRQIQDSSSIHYGFTSNWSLLENSSRAKTFQILKYVQDYLESNLQHGYFVASSNGFIYSNNDEASNNTKWALTFKTGDEITIEIDQKDNKMSIKKKNDSKSYAISLKHLSENDWKDLHLCVCLNVKDDKVQIMH
jgi:hypothetical protein